MQARLGAARILLQSLKGKETHAAASKTQKDAVVELCRTPAYAEVSCTDVASLVTKASMVAWAPGDGHDATQALSGAPKRTRRSPQMFMAFPGYYTQDHWAVFNKVRRTSKGWWLD